MMFQRILSYTRRQTLATCALFPQSPPGGASEWRKKEESTGGFLLANEEGKLGRGRDDLNQARVLVFLPETETEMFGNKAAK